jgi:hypothetical protein
MLRSQRIMVTLPSLFSLIAVLFTGGTKNNQ